MGGELIERIEFRHAFVEFDEPGPRIDQIRSSEAMAADLNDDGITAPRRQGVESLVAKAKNQAFGNMTPLNQMASGDRGMARVHRFLVRMAMLK